MPNIKHYKTPQQLWESISSVLVNFVENVFFTIGVVVARYPWRTIILTCVFVLLSSIGLLKFYTEKDPMKLWVPPDSSFIQDTDWYIDKFGTVLRVQKVLLVSENILEPNNLMKMYNITHKVNSLQVNYNNTNVSLSDLCYNVPIVNFYSSDDNASDFSDPTLWVADEFYCSFLETFSYACLQYNILDLWKNDPTLIKNTTKHDIIKKINGVKNNPVTGHPTDYTKLLGGVKTDENGQIVSANSVLLSWYTEVNISAVDLNEVGNLVGTEKWVTIPLALWEAKFLELMQSESQNSSTFKVYYEAGRSFGDISGEAMFQEVDKLFIGIVLMFFYIVYGLSRFNWLEIKLIPSAVGLLSVALAYVTSLSWCSILGVSFGPVHSALPFLLMGLGIDDMFVINACWNTVCESDLKKSLPVKVGLTMKHAGVSIVITSFTDIVALLIGAITILPSLKSFCIYAAVGVFFIFCFTVTFYVAVFTLDLKRMEANLNGILFCYKHKERIYPAKDKTILQKLLLLFYKNIVFTIPGKSIVLLFTLMMTGYSVLGVLKLEQRFDLNWFIPEGTYYKQFLDKYELFYPDQGHAAMVFLGEMNYNAEFRNLHSMAQELKNESYVKDFETWVEPFHAYILSNYNRDLTNSSSLVTDFEFKQYLSKFLYSPIGGRYQVNFKFSERFKCGQQTPNITASSMSFRFSRFSGPEEYLPAMNYVKDVVKSTNITSGDGYRSVWSQIFANWVTDEIIAVEVERNIELALLCVMICTVILITNLQMCLWIFMCVLLTIVNVLGWMQRWGMTVDIVSCIGLELAIGLCVDYAAHVGHTFLTTYEGTRTERALKTMTSIGAAVFLGGGSTLLALSLLSMSKVHTFKSFFKIFLLVILFGLFHGLAFLPVVLSLIGPKAYRAHKEKAKQNEMVELNGKNLTDKQIDDG